MRYTTLVMKKTVITKMNAKMMLKRSAVLCASFVFVIGSNCELHGQEQKAKTPRR